MARRKEAERADPIEPGLHLLISESGRILRAAPIRNAPRRHLQPPFLGPETVMGIEKPISELVLEFLSSDGLVLDAFGWPWTSEAFHDGPIGAALAQEGSPVGRLESRQPIRILRVPLPPSAAFLLSSESFVEFTFGGANTFGRRGKALYSLPPSDLPPPPLGDYAKRLEVEPLPGTQTPIEQL